MLKITLKKRQEPVKLSINKKETFILKAVYYILIDEVSGVANVYNSYTHIKYKFNHLGFYRVDERNLERLKKNIKIVCVEATLQDISLIK